METKENKNLYGRGAGTVDMGIFWKHTLFYTVQFNESFYVPREVIYLYFAD